MAEEWTSGTLHFFVGKVTLTACDSREAVTVSSQSFYHHTGTGVRSTCLGSSLSISVGFLYIGERSGCYPSCGRNKLANLFAGSVNPSLSGCMQRSHGRFCFCASLSLVVFCV